MSGESVFAPHSAYKASEIGWLGDMPSHWDAKRLRFAVRLNPSKSEITLSERSNPVSFLRMDAVGDDGTLRLDEQRNVSDVESGYTYFRDGDVTIAKITPCFENGKGAVMRDLVGGIGFGTTELIVARPISRQATSEYINWIFNSTPFRKLGEGAMYGAGGQKRVPDDFIKNFAIGLPPLSEQNQIVRFLGRETTKIDLLIQKQERLIELLQEKRQAVISHAVTKGLDPTVPMKDSGIEWLGYVPKNWKLHPLKFQWSVTDCKHLTAEFVENGIPLASIREVQSWLVDLGEAKQTTNEFYDQLISGGRKPREGDIIFSRNATVGETAKVIQDHPTFAMGQDVCLLRKRQPDYSTDFLMYVMRSAVVKIQLDLVMIGSTFKRVNVEEIKNLIMPLPPPHIQTQIAQFISLEMKKIDELISKATQAIELMKERRSALISAAVTGKIDVREAA